jgi:WD40 repeat protein
MMAYDRNKGISASSVSFSASGRYLFAGYKSEEAGSVVAWDTFKGEPVYELAHPSGVTCTSVSPDGNTLFTGCIDTIGRVSKGTVVELIKIRFGRKSEAFVNKIFRTKHCF